MRTVRVCVFGHVYLYVTIQQQQHRQYGSGEGGSAGWEEKSILWHAITVVSATLSISWGWEPGFGSGSVSIVRDGTTASTGQTLAWDRRRRYDGSNQKCCPAHVGPALTLAIAVRVAIKLFFCDVVTGRAAAMSYEFYEYWPTTTGTRHLFFACAEVSVWYWWKFEFY